MLTGAMALVDDEKRVGRAFIIIRAATPFIDNFVIRHEKLRRRAVDF